MAIEKVLIVDEESTSRTFLHELLRKRKCEVFSAESGAEAISLIHQHLFDLVICDLRIQGSNGLDILKNAKAQSPQTLVILTTAVACIESAVEAIRLGAFNYLLKPFSTETIETMLDRVQQHIDLLQENYYLREEISTQPDRKKQLLIAESEMMKQILSDVSKIAKSSSSVFISGESGTGKEVIAQAIHSQSHRTLQPFIKVNCAAIPSALLESEFFGHEKGSFTGAINKKLGRFELADKGTLLLDEISEIPLELQSKLLRAVQEMEFERVGGIRPIQVDVRLISTSNRSMKEAVEQKLFREDLYYRLNVVPIHLPPLRERKEDILPLAEYFLARLCEDNQKTSKRLAISARQKLTDYHWPGNIRELANVIERTVVMNSSDYIEAHQVYIDLSCPIKEAPSSSFPVGITLAEVEKRLILETLAREKNNRTKTAQVLGISIRTLRNKLHAYKTP
ncbi:MAG: sigma-54-dependent Fis family transcriptional regulator [Verrucomicrobia bacterium]|nr:sigma-54-dependent Fis family transcriptional regulator [Verrucomicrobiota bacterium]